MNAKTYNPRPRNIGIYDNDGDQPVAVIHAESHREALKLYARTRHGMTPLIVGNVASIGERDYTAKDVS